MRKELQQHLPEKMREPLGFITLHDRFLQWLRKKNYSPGSIFIYSYHLYDFFGWCAERSLMSPIEITMPIMRAYQAYIDTRLTRKGTPLASGSKNRIGNALIVFFNWVFREKLLLINPARAIVLPKMERKVQPALTHEEVEEVMAKVDITTPAGVRNRAMLETLYSTGMRRKELVSLTIDDLDLDRGLVFVREGKGQKDRLIPIGERAVRWIEKYLIEARPMLIRNEDEPALFINNQGLAFPPNSFTEIIGDYVHSCGKPGACHLFRHTAATLMLENGAPVSQIQKLLGHSSITSTHIYTKVTLDKLEEVLKDTHPAPDMETGNLESPISPFTPPKGEIPIPPNCKKKSGNSCLTETPAQGTLFAYGQEYLRWMEEKGFAGETRYKRWQHIKYFLDWCWEREITLPAQITCAILDCYQTHLLHQKKKDGRYLSASYRKRLLISLSQFLNYLLEHEIILVVPENIDLPKTPKKLPYHLSQEEIEKILSSPDITTPMGVRDRTILETLYATALHSREIVNLTLPDIDLAQGTLRVRATQYQKERLLPLTERVVYWLQKYIFQVRPQMLQNSTIESLFLGKYGKALHSATLYEILRIHIGAADIGKTGGCQLFRYAAAISMLENGADLRYLQEFLGHQALSSTQHYNDFTIHKLKQIHDQTHPARMKPTKGDEVRKELETDLD